jgi:hypothetical protein
MRAATRVPTRRAAVPARCARSVVPALRVVSRSYATQKYQSPVPDNVVRNGGFANARKWFFELLRRGPISSLKTINKMDEVRWGTLVGEDQFGNKYVVLRSLEPPCLAFLSGAQLPYL